MIVALKNGVKGLASGAEGLMKKGFCNLVSGVILLGSFVTAARAEPILTSVEQTKKEKVQIVVVVKKGRDKANGGGEAQRPGPDRRN